MIRFKKLILFVLMPLLFCGCQVKPEEAVGAFMKYCAQKNTHNASVFLTPEYRKTFLNFPFALRNYNYGITKIKWQLSDMSKTRAGLQAHVFTTIYREWPAPGIIQAYLKMNLINKKGKWFINSINTVIPEYTFFTEKPNGSERYYTFSLLRPKWEVKTNIDEPLVNFLKKYNEDCRSWLH